MKFSINYDFFNAIRDVNEPLTPMKIVRNNKFIYTFGGPLFLLFLQVRGTTNIDELQSMLIFYSSFISTDVLIDYYLKNKVYDGVDRYAHDSSIKLKRLLTMLESINVETNYEMLLKSKLYERKLKVEPSSDNLLLLKEEKYIYVPSYGFDGREKETSILQEHNVGSANYTLSVGRPEKQHRLVLANNYA